MVYFKGRTNLGNVLVLGSRGGKANFHYSYVAIIKGWWALFQTIKRTAFLSVLRSWKGVKVEWNMKHAFYERDSLPQFRSQSKGKQAASPSLSVGGGLGLHGVPSAHVGREYDSNIHVQPTTKLHFYTGWSSNLTKSKLYPPEKVLSLPAAVFASWSVQTETSRFADPEAPFSVASVCPQLLPFRLWFHWMAPQMRRLAQESKQIPLPFHWAHKAHGTLLAHGCCSTSQKSENRNNWQYKAGGVNF